MNRTLGVFGAAGMVGVVGLACGIAGAQQSSDPNQGQPQVIHPAPSGPLGGVPSAAPRSTPNLQGVPVSLPNVTPPVGVPQHSTRGPTTPITQTPQPVLLVPPAGPGATTPVVGPAVGPVDNTRSALIQRMVDARYGPGYSVVNGQLVQDQPKTMPMTGGWPAGSTMPATWAVPAYSPTDGTIHGYYNNGKDFRLVFAWGNGFPIIQSGWDTSYGKYPSRLYRSYYSPWEDWDRYRNDPWGYNNPYMIVAGDSSYMVDPRITSRPADAVMRDLTPLEKAEIALKSGDASDAVKQFKLHLKDSPDDAGVERMLGLALIDDRKIDQGVAVLIHAYTKQPHMAQDPLDLHILSGTDMDERHRFGMVMDYASRVKTGSSYFAAAVLAQAEGRFDTAKRMLDRSIDMGLDKKVAEEMKIAIATR